MRQIKSPHPLDETEYNIGLDIDGTLAAFAQGFVQEAHDVGIPYYDHYTLWNQWAAKEDMKEDFFKMWDHLEDNWEFWSNLDPLEKAFVPYEVSAYVTSRSSAPVGVDDLWLSRHGFPPAPVFRVEPYDNKVERLMWINGSPNESLDVYVDDKAETVRDVLEAYKSGEDVPFPLLITTPANSRFSKEDNSDLPRVDYLPEVPEAAEKFMNLTFQNK